MNNPFDLISRIIEKSKVNQKQQVVKNAAFFLTSQNYKQFKEDMYLNFIDAKNVNSLSLECSGHGSFNKQNVLRRFLEYLTDALDKMTEIKKLKIKISGVELNSKSQGSSEYKIKIIQQISSLVTKIIKLLSSLQIRVSNVQNCTLNDFKAIMGLGINTEADNLSNLSLQFSDWSFGSSKNPRNFQPTLAQFNQSFSILREGLIGNKSLQSIKKFRLQISTWFYTQNQYERFISSVKSSDYGPKNKNQNEYHQNIAGKKITTKQQYFHNVFAVLIEDLLTNVMPNLTLMQLDFRNWNKKFEMAQLKSSLANINNQSKVSSLSAISKRYSVSKREIANKQLSRIQQPKVQQNYDNKEEQETKNFDIIIVI